MKHILSDYIVISPVKDEAHYIEETMRSVVGQTTTPSQWIIVDDGSIDNTTNIAERYSHNYPWIKLLKISRDAKRMPGSAVINAFNKGYELIKDAHFDFIVKLDCDVRFGPGYFEGLISKFQEDEKLGIASGRYLENRGGSWHAIRMPAYHAAGASKIIRKECFEQIGGFIPSRGWDTVDEIRAQIKGWRTYHFKELEFYHLKTEGSGIGQLRTNMMLGEIYYLTGGGRLFLLLKIIHRILFYRPFFVAGVLMFWGYLRPLVLRRELLVSNEESKFYKQLLNRRIYYKVKELLPLRGQ